jgi:regulator of RNase E activity RraA
MNSFERPSKKLIRELNKLAVATAISILRDITRGPVNALVMDNLRPLYGADYKLCGPAVTIEFEEEPLYAHNLSMERAQEERVDVETKAKDSLKTGDVIVNAALGHAEYGTYGDVKCHAFKGKGAAGAITDGVFKDSPFLRRMKDFPIYTYMGDAVAYSRHGTFSGSNPITATDYNVEVVCDDVIVRPGDIILADEAVIVLPIELAEQVAEIGVPLEESEILQRKLALTGLFEGRTHLTLEEANELIKKLTKNQAKKFDLLAEWESLNVKK